MQKTLLLTLLAFIACYCTPKTNEGDKVSVDSIATSADSIASSSMPDREQQIAETTTETEEANELNYVVVVAEGYHYDSLRSLAISSSKFLHYKFDTLDRYYNSRKKKIVLPDNYDDEMWAGEYYLRREGGNVVSIEMMNAYIDTLTEQDDANREAFYQDSTKMFVFASMYAGKEQADSLANVLRTKFPSARIIPSKIYMGCMH